ncbi:gamma-glutamylcyclotransferase family protein [Spirosoma rhododendri]|uniref:Gamma-glutamylcyclotransferase n=1 Tax=Spirosoma rhododendri TaxID=2728024 RepID=A0A7L5DIS1_9BACT|nr:gamma-glutamylcyclotransferase family protein [Spirosoma rhododendri]QJD77965.1 gamma-glutamylcyclotransferase [Spirosoma rhododendri]
MGSRPTHLFVYGTLRVTFTNPAAVQLRQVCQYVGEGLMPGRLYDLGDYPGAIHLPTAHALVHGSVYALLTAPDALLATLDSYEGVNTPPDPADEYRRESVLISLPNQRIDCWVYLYNQAITDQHCIEAGDYVQYLEA